MGLVDPVVGNGQGSHLLGCGWGQGLVLFLRQVQEGEVGRKIVGQACEGVQWGCLHVGLLASAPGRCLAFGPISCQGRCLGAVGCDVLWLTVALDKVGPIGTFGTRGCKSNQVVVG